MNSGCGRGAAHLLPTLALALIAAASVCFARAEELPPPASAEKRADAALRDLIFLDLEQGWAVGERGAIWHTADGGRHWQLQETPTSAALASVWFVDAKTGFAAGGFTHPVTHRSAGVLLATTNGGGTWEPVKGLLVPAFEKIRFFDARRGWALTRASAMYPSGVVKTDDGGRSFTAVQGPPARAQLTAEFTEPGRGLVLQEGRGVFGLGQGELTFLGALPATGLRAPRCVKFVGRDRWMVGDGGLLLRSLSGGPWQAPESLPAEMNENVDFRTLAAVGSQMWIAGTPGSVVFHSADGGRTWTRQLTGQSLPLSAIAFADENHGWAVGALGTMLITRDGGQTWRRTRGGGERVALLGVFAEPQNTPWELVARECGEEGYLTAAECLHRRDLDAGGAASTLNRRARDAFSQLGTSGAEFAWQFPLREQGLELPLAKAALAWQRPAAATVTGSDNTAALEAYLVRAIRQWRPEVIVTEPHEGRAVSVEQEWVHRALLNAVEKAADVRAFPELFESLALAPWNAKKVFAALPPGEQGTITLNTAQLALRLGRSLAEEGLAARALVEADCSQPPPARTFQLLVDRTPGGSGKRGVFDGLNLAPGSETRRILGAPVRHDLATLKQMAVQRASVEQLLAQSKADAAPGTLAAQLAELTRGLGEESAGQVMFQLAGHYRTAGRSELAAETYALLVDKFPQHPLNEAALVWLVRYYASAEEAVRLKLAPVPEVQLAHLEPARQVLAPVTPTPPAPATEAAEKTSAPLTAAARRQRACDYMQRLERARPDLYSEPEVRFPLAAASRALGQGRDALAWAEACAAAPGDEGWRGCAQAELWLARPESVCTKLCLKCPRAVGRPKLDGRLDDALWQTAAVVELKSAFRDDTQWPASARLARDDEFLYLSAVCRKAPGASYAAAVGPRPRDADLVHEDRVEFTFDVDRDYATSFRLAIDHRGFTQESCGDDLSWNPRWFVARASDAGEYTVEAAIPLAELAPRMPAAGETWALGISRIVLSAGFQSWSRPAGISPRPSGFGLLQFE